MKVIGCETIGLLVPSYVDGELVGEDEEAVETHVHRCGRCRAVLEREQELLDLMRGRTASSGEERGALDPFESGARGE